MGEVIKCFSEREHKSIGINAGLRGDAVLLLPQHGGAQHGAPPLGPLADEPLARTFPRTLPLPGRGRLRRWDGTHRFRRRVGGRRAQLARRLAPALREHQVRPSSLFMQIANLAQSSLRDLNTAPRRDNEGVTPDRAHRRSACEPLQTRASLSSGTRRTIGGKRSSRARVLFFTRGSTHSLFLFSALLLFNAAAFLSRRLYSSFQERNHKRDISFSEVTTVASFAPTSAVHLNHLTPNGSVNGILKLRF